MKVDPRNEAPRLPTEEECRKAAADIAAEAIVRTMSRDPRNAAVAAYVEGGPSVEELEARIRHFHAEAEARIAAARESG